MNSFELLRHDDTIRNDILNAQRQVAAEEHAAAVALWGEQPDSLALPAEGALRGDSPLSGSEKENK